MSKNIKVILELDTRDFDRGVSKVDGKLDKLESSASKTSASFVKVGAAIAGVASAAAGLASSIQAASSVEQLGITLETIYGDANQAAIGLEQVTEAAGKLPLSLADIQRGVPSLALVEDQFGSLQESIEFTAGIANAFGMSFDEAASQVQRSLTSGISSADMFRERGVSAFLGFEAGAKYTAEETREVFLKSFDAVTAANEKAAQSMAGQYSMIQDAVFQVQEAFGTAFGETLKELMSGANEAFSQNKEIILQNAKAIGENLGSALKSLIENLDIVISAVSGFAAAWAAVKLAGIITSIRTMITTFGTLNAVMAANPIGLVATAIGLLVAGLMQLEQSTGLVSEAFVWMGNSIIEIINGVGNHIESMAIKVVGIGGIIKDAFDPSNWGEGFFGGISEAIDQVKADAQAAFDEDPITFRFGLDEEAAKTVVDQLQEVEVSATRVAETYQKVSDKMSEADKERERLHERDIKRADILLDRWEDKNKNLERETEIMDAINGMSEEEGRLKKELMNVEFARRDALKEIENMLVSDAERNQLTQDLNELTQEQIDLITDRHEKAMEYNAKESEADQKLHDNKIKLAEQGNKIMADLNNQAMSSMEDAFVNFVDTGKLSFKDLVDDMIKQLKRLLAKKIFETILGIFGGGGGIGGFFAGLLIRVELSQQVSLA